MSSECLKAAEVIIGTLARSANPREVICMVFEAFGKAPSPPLQLLLLRAVPTVLPRLTRKRAEFACTCLESLGARYLDEAWPGDGWDDEEEACSKDSKPASFHLLAALLESVAPLAPEAAAAVPSECGDEQSDRADAGAQRARQLLLGFLWRALEHASNLRWTLPRMQVLTTAPFLPHRHSSWPRTAAPSGARSLPAPTSCSMRSSLDWQKWRRTSLGQPDRMQPLRRQPDRMQPLRRQLDRMQPLRRQLGRMQLLRRQLGRMQPLRRQRTTAPATSPRARRWPRGQRSAWRST